MLKAILFSLIAAIAPIQAAPSQAAPTQAPSTQPTNQSTGYPGPGVVIDHSPASSRIYLGSPALVILSDGSYLAKCDEFGPGSTNTTRGVSLLFHSTDRGQTWQQIARVEDIYWASLFTHGHDVYLMGTTTESGSAVIRRSRDSGQTWTDANDKSTGLLLEGHFHTGPVPVLEYAGRFWRAYEENAPPSKTAGSAKAFIMSASADTDLLNADAWSISQQLNSQKSWLDGTFTNWQEGNALAAPDGSIVDVLRVNQPHWPEKAAIINFDPASSTGRKSVVFNPESDIIDLPGGGKRFTIRFDEKSKLYWCLSSYVPEKDQVGQPEKVRNTLALIASKDLHTWEIRATLLHHDDVKKHSFQYADWQFEGDDLIAVVRTAADDNEGGAHSFHDNNYLTFHRFPNFRDLH